MNKSAKLDAGTVVAGRYRVEREIGRGGMAQVYEARHTDIGKAVAVKILAAEFASSPVVVERFLREARAAAAVHSPYICDVYDSGKLDDGRPFLVMELLKGESLYERMVRVRQFDPETTARIVAQVARGLMKAHAAGIVHRDLKPENIFLTTNEEGDLHAKVLDFGLAKFYEQNDGTGAQARLTREGAIFGTPAYMSPEQVQGQGAVDNRADLWALGCIAYECLTGRTVWSTDKGIAMTFAQIASAQLPKLSRYRPDLPPTVEAWFEKALSREVDERFQTAKELAEGFATAVDFSASGLLFTSEVSRVGPSPLTDEIRQQLAAAEAGGVRPAAGAPAAGAPAAVSLGTGAAENANTPPPASTREGSSAALPSAQVPSSNAPSVRPPERQESLAGDLGTSNTVKRPAERPGARWPMLLVGVIGVLGGAVGAWQFVRPPSPVPSATTSAGVVPSVPSASSAASASSSAPVVASAPVADPQLLGLRWLPLISEGQAKLVAGDLPEAAKRFKEAQDSMSSAVGKSMLDHVTVARENKGSCRLSALARLRSPLVSSQSAGRPLLVKTSRGLMALWSDDHETVGHDHIYAQLLDVATLRPEGKPVDVTPDADRVVKFAVAVQGERVALLYTVRGIQQQAVLLRWLEADGRVSAAPVQVAGAKASQGEPSLAVDGGTLWGAWEERGESDKTDLMMARLSGEGGVSPLRMTDLRVGRFKPRVVAPHLAASGGNLAVVFRVDRDVSRPVSLLQVPGTDPGLVAGLPAATPTQKEDRVVGHMVAITSVKDKGDTPDIACSKEGCFATWHVDPSGNLAAFAVAQVNPQKGDVPWSKRFPFTGHGGRPSLGVNDDGEVLVAWYDNNRIQVAPLTGREGLGARSQVAHAANDRPPASVVGVGPREWAVAWLDFEKGKLEPYVLRASCR